MGTNGHWHRFRPARDSSHTGSDEEKPGMWYVTNPDLSGRVSDAWQADDDELDDGVDLDALSMQAQLETEASAWLAEQCGEDAD